MTILLTNDDGFDAPGLAALADVASSWGKTVVVAPHEHVSGCSHQVTTHRPLDLQEVRPDWFMLDGSPGDCVRVGLAQVALDVDWIIAGINAGGNLGADVYLSGTVAAAREACLFGKRAIAISQYYRQSPIDWDITRRWAAQTLHWLAEHTLPSDTFWNVNLPDPRSATDPKCRFCSLDPHPLPVAFDQRDGKLHYRGNYHQRPRASGCDVDVCFAGQIAVTPIGLSHRVTLT